MDVCPLVIVVAADGLGGKVAADPDDDGGGEGERVRHRPARG